MVLEMSHPVTPKLGAVHTTMLAAAITCTFTHPLASHKPPTCRVECPLKQAQQGLREAGCNTRSSAPRTEATLAMYNSQTSYCLFPETDTLCAGRHRHSRLEPANQPASLTCETPLRHSFGTMHSGERPLLHTRARAQHTPAARCQPPCHTQQCARMGPVVCGAAPLSSSCMSQQQAPL